MSTVLIVGHPCSKYQQVSEFVFAAGVRAAIPSRRETTTPQQITERMLRSNAASFQDASGVIQITPQNYWQALIFDLILENEGHSSWGWADPQSLYFLEFWKGILPDATFILTYSLPEKLFSTQLTNHKVSHEEIMQAVSHWREYHEALLHFYYRNSESCVLVHADQVCKTPEVFLDEVAMRFTIDLQYPELQLSSEAQTNSLTMFLATALAESAPELAAVYEELQSVATLPLLAFNKVNPLLAWNEQLAKQQQMDETTRLLHEHKIVVAERQQQLESAEQIKQEVKQENELLLLQLHQVQEELERFYREKEQLSASRDEQARLVIERQVEITRLAQETSDLTVMRDQQMKLDAERQQQIEQLSKVCSEQTKLAEERRIQLDAAVKEKSDLISARDQQIKLAAERQQQIESLTQQLAHTAVQLDNEMRQENELLLLQLHQVQEELERYYLENMKLTKLQTNRGDGGDSHTTRQHKNHYGAAARVKRQLSYRLGATMIEQSRSFSGWLGMPWALLHQVRIFKQEKAARQGEKLPPIERYADAHQAERVRQHLSFRLGSTLLAQYHSPIGWLKLPWKLRKDYLDFKQRRSTR